MADDPARDSAGVLYYVSAVAAWEPDAGKLGLALAVRDIVAVTSEDKLSAGWLLGFGVADESHEPLPFPEGYVKTVRIRVAGAEPEPARLAVTKSGFERSRVALEEQIDEPEPAGGADRGSPGSLAATKSAFGRARAGLEELTGHERFFVVGVDANEPLAEEDNRTIADAQRRGVDCQRLAPVVLPDGQVLRFEVRFGDAAVSKRMLQRPASGIIQVNLDTEFTQVIVLGENNAGDGGAPQAEPPQMAAGGSGGETPPPREQRPGTPPPRPATPPLLSHEQSVAMQAEESLIAAQVQALELADGGGTGGTPGGGTTPRDSRPPPRAAFSWAEEADALLRSGEFEWPGGEFDDGDNCVGYLCYISGSHRSGAAGGRGTIQAFERATWGASAHHILMDDGEVQQVRLQRRGNKHVEWLVGAWDVGAVRTSSAGESRGAMLTAKMVPIEAVARSEVAEGHASLSKNCMTSGDGTVVLVKDSNGAALYKADELQEPLIAIEFAAGTPLRIPGRLPTRDEDPETPRPADLGLPDGAPEGLGGALGAILVEES